MSAMTIELPEPVRERIERVARSQGVSAVEFVLRAAADKAAAVASVDALGRRIAGARREVFDRVMSAVPDADPPELDRVD